jgi:hypothetical protein
MNRWLNIFFGFFIIMIMSAIYLLDSSLQLMALLLLFSLTIVFIRDRTRFAVVYLGVMINLLYLCLALWLMDGQISFLSDESFTPFYKKALLLETIFWATFAGLFGLYMRLSQSSAVNGAKIQMHYPIQLQLFTAITILALEIMISSGAYFKPYSEVSDTGTIAYELGCLLLAISIISRTDNPSRANTLILEGIGVVLALFIVLGSGKRLPFAYVIIAYLLFSMKHYGKLRTLLLYLGISGLGFVLGVVRDFMSVDGLNTDLLAVGFGSSNQGAVLHASAVYLRVADEGLITVIDRGISFFSNFVGALVLPLSLLPEQTQVNVQAMQYYNVQGNGGFVGTYSYFFIDWMGPTLLASILAWLCSRRGHWLELVIVIILLTSPRWTLYNIGPVLRLISMALLVTVCIHFLYKFFCIGRRRLSGLDF